MNWKNLLIIICSWPIDLICQDYVLKEYRHQNEPLTEHAIIPESEKWILVEIDRKCLVSAKTTFGLMVNIGYSRGTDIVYIGLIEAWPGEGDFLLETELPITLFNKTELYMRCPAGQGIKYAIVPEP